MPTANAAATSSINSVAKMIISKKGIISSKNDFNVNAMVIATNLPKDLIIEL